MFARVSNCWSTASRTTRARRFEPRVLATGDGEGIADGGTVTATVEEHVLGKKILVFTYKPKRNSRKRRGHRSRLSRVRIESITA